MNPTLKDLLWVLAGAICIWLGALVQVTLPDDISAVPITLQTLVVLTLPFLMPEGLSKAAVALYLVAGIAGLPVFSGGESGVEYFTATAAGYLLGFILAVTILEMLLKKATGNYRFLGVFLMQLFGSILILLCGAIYLGIQRGFDNAFTAYALPYMPGALIKSILGAGIVILWYRYVLNRQ